MVPPAASAVLLDLDGTLTGPGPGITRSLGYALERMGMAAPLAESLTWCIGPPLARSLPTLLGSSPCTASGLWTPPLGRRLSSRPLPSVEWADFNDGAFAARRG